MGRKLKPRPELPVVTRYVTPDGKRCSKSHPQARKVTTRAESYFVRLPNPETGKREWFPLKTIDQATAWVRLREELDRRAREEAGLGGPLLVHATRPLAEHIEEWVAELADAGRTGEEQRKLVRARVLKLVELAGWERLPQITRATALSALAGLQKERCRGMPADHQGRSAQTRNHYLRALKQFCTWAAEDGRMERSPVAGLDPVNVDVDRRHARRVPADQEVARLLAYLGGLLVPEGQASPIAAAVRCGMDGPTRALGYLVCMATGLRADELRGLSAVSFDLDHATVTSRAGRNKNRKTATLHLPPWLVAELQAHFAGGGGCWERFPENHPGRLLKADLAACEVEYALETADGPRYFDFHALRHWYLTWAGNLPGISPKALQTLARHADPALTLKVYAAPLDEEVRRAVGGLKKPGSGPADTPVAG